MTLYDLWLNLLQTLFGTIKFFKDHPTVPGLIYLIFKQNSIRKIINKQLPKKFRDTVDSDILEIKEDIKLIKKHFGVVGEWQSNGQQNGLKQHPLSFNKLYVYLRKVIQSENQLRRKTKMKLLLNSQWSKKLFAFLLLVVINGLNDVLGLHLSPATIERVTTLGGTYILAQAGVDAIKPILLYVVGLITTMSGGTQNVDTKPTGDSGNAV